MASDYFEIFGSRDVLTFMEGVSLQAAEEKDPVLRARLLKMLAELQGELRALATRTATEADRAANEKVEIERKRPEGRDQLHIRDVLKSEPLGALAAVGGVGIANLDKLDRIPFWRAQEFGTGSSEIVSQIGRELRGAFMGGGVAPARPNPTLYQEHSYFQPGGQPFGEGTIQREIEPMGYLAFGSDVAWAEYRQGIARISKEYAKRLRFIYSSERALGSLVPGTAARLRP